MLRGSYDESHTAEFRLQSICCFFSYSELLQITLVSVKFSHVLLDIVDVSCERSASMAMTTDDVNAPSNQRFVFCRHENQDTGSGSS